MSKQAARVCKVQNNFSKAVTVDNDTVLNTSELGRKHKGVLDMNKPTSSESEAEKIEIALNLTIIEANTIFPGQKR